MAKLYSYEKRRDNVYHVIGRLSGGYAAAMRRRLGAMIMTSFQTTGDPVASYRLIVSMLIRDSAIAL